jgi:hypothetical protein
LPAVTSSSLRSVRIAGPAAPARSVGPGREGRDRTLPRGAHGREAPFADLIAREGWYCDLRPLRHLSHFITPTSSLIRFTARFFLCPVPAG